MDQHNLHGYSPQPSNGAGTMPNQFIPSPPPPLNAQPMTPDGINAFFSSAPTQFIGQQFVQGGQQYMQRFQEKIGALSGSVLNYHFAISNEYVRKKLAILLTPYLRSRNFSRHPEQIPGGPRFRAPRADVNCPDLYIPIMGFCTYAVLCCLRDFALSTFTTESMYTKVYTGLLGWLMHLLVFKSIMYMMSLPSVSFIESACYSGYMFVLLAVCVVSSLLRVRYSWTITWLYCSFCMAVFLVRSLKRLLHHEARYHGGDINRYNYLLLALAAFQFFLLYFMG